MTKKELTPIEQKQIDALGKLWEIFDFNKSEIARACGVEPPVVSNWFKRGRISATAAIKLSRNKLVKGKLTKEEMRPDVEQWFGV